MVIFNLTLAGHTGQESMTTHDRINPVKSLSNREREVLRQTAAGFTSVEIAEALAISPKSVETYRARLMKKLAITHRSELVRIALQTGLLKP